MTNYQQTVGKRSNWQNRHGNNTGAIPLIGAVGAGTAIKSAIAGLGVGTFARRLINKNIGGGGRNSNGDSSDGDSSDDDSSWGDDSGDSDSGWGSGDGTFVNVGSGSNLTSLGGAGLLGYSLNDILNGEVPGTPGGMSIGGLLAGGSLMAGSIWLGSQSNFDMDNPVTAVSGAGMASGIGVLFMTYREAQAQQEGE